MDVQLAAHEMHDLHELALSCVNSITNMGYFLQHIQDPELKALVEKHLPYHIRDYDIKVEYLRKAQGAETKLPIPELNATLPSFTASPTANYVPVTPRTNVQEFNDREMATAYLLTLKRAGREYAWSAMEMSNPEIRAFCQNAFLMSCNHAYEVWQWLVKKGYYPLETADLTMTEKIGDMYGMVPPQ
jgi:spore coat protein CotF